MSLLSLQENENFTSSTTSSQAHRLRRSYTDILFEFSFFITPSLATLVEFSDGIMLETLNEIMSESLMNLL
jgi:hypothetical protein